MAKTYKSAVVITGDSKGAVSAVNKTQSELGGLNKKVKESAAEFADITKKAAAWAAVAGGVAIAGATALVKRQLDLIDSTAKTSDKLGIATEKLTAMRIQAELTGVASNTLDMGLQRMVRRVAEAAQGTGEASGALKELNLDARELNSLSPDEQFNAIADAMGNVEGQSDKVRLAFKLFDSEGVALVNTLKGGSAAAREAQQFTEQWGLALTRVDAAKIEQANDAMTLLGSASEGFWKQLTVKVAPAITGVVGEIMGMGEEFGTSEDLATAAFNKIVTGVGYVADGIRGLQVVYKGVTVLVAELLAKNAEFFAAMDSGITAVLNKLPKALGGGTFTESDFIQNMAGAMRSTADQLAGELADLVEKAMPSQVINKKLKEWENNSQQAAEKVADSVAVATGAYDKNIVAIDSLLISKDKLNRKLDVETVQAVALANAYGDTIGAIETENAWLQRELRAVKNGEAALRAFNKEKAVELALRNENVYKLQPEEIARYKELIEQNYDLQQEIGNLTDKQNDFQAAVDRGLERLDDSFFEFYKNMVLDGKASFDDLKDVAINALLEITYAYARADLFSALKLPGSSGSSMPGGGQGGISDLFSLSSLSNLLGSTPLAGLGDLVANAGMDMGSRTIHGIGKNLQSMSAMDIGLSALAAYAGDYLGSEVGKALFGKEAESSIATTIGGIGGTLIGGPLGSLIGSTLGSIIDTAFGGDGYRRQAMGASVAPVMPGQQSTGYAAYGASGLTYQGLTEGEGDADLANQFANVLASTDTAITSLASMLAGRNLTGRLEGQALPGSNSQGAWGPNFFGSLDGSSLDDALTSFEDTLAQRITKLTGTVLDLDAIRAMGQEGEALGDTIYRVQGELITVNGLFDALGIKTLQFSTAGLSAADTLVSAAGGLDALVSATDYYYQNVYSETERAQILYDQHAASIATFNDTYGTAIESTDDLRAYVDQLTTSQNWGSEATQRAYVAALNLTPALVEQAKAADTLAISSDDAVESVAEISSALKSLQSASAKLEAELLQAQGKTDQYAAAIRAIDTEGMTPAEIAIYDYNNALRDQINSLDAAAEAERKLAASRYGMETQILQLTGNTAALRERELAETDPALRAMQQLIWSIEDQQAAQNASQSADISAFASAQSSYNSSLEALNNSVIDNSDNLADLTNAVDAERKAAEEMAKAASGLSGVLSDFRLSDLSPMGAQDRMDFARSEYERLLSASQGGDINALGLLGDAARDYLTEAQQFDPGAAYTALFNQISSQIGPLAYSGGQYPAFAEGGNHAGGWAIVGERGPELANIGPSRIYSNNDSRALFDDSRIVDRLDKLAAENQQLRAEVNALRAERRANDGRESDQMAEQTRAIKNSQRKTAEYN